MSEENEEVCAGAAALDDEDQTLATGYVAPAQKNIKEILECDKEDDALERYKKTLLGDNADMCNDGPLVVNVLSMTFLPQKTADDGEGEAEPIEIDLTRDLKETKIPKITIKAGCEYQLKIKFHVKNQIVSGLVLQQQVSRHKLGVSNLRHMVGSYRPNAAVDEVHEYTTPLEEAPKGSIALGTYTSKCKFIDDDKHVHLAWEWSFKIANKWDKN